jgi:hypothetical protein
MEYLPAIVLVTAGIEVVLLIVWVFRRKSSTTRQGSAVPTGTTPVPTSQRLEIVVCPSCHNRNRLREADVLSRFRCGFCRAELPNPFAGPTPTKTEPIPTFRPCSSTSLNENSVSFRDSSGDVDSVAARDLAGLVDAFTGEALDSALGLYQCGNCEVYYHGSSFEVIKSENGGRCVSCLKVSVREVAKAASRRNSTQNFNFEPDVVTLDNYRDHVGRVITFEGIVRKVLKSRNGRDYAVMFEDKDWSVGLKMVVLRGTITAVGGGDFLRRLNGRTVRVRGLLQNHPIFGFQIAVSERRMIQL